MCTAVALMLATANVQANQCSSDGGCPSDTKLQNVVTLLETNLRMNVLQERGASAMLCFRHHVGEEERDGERGIERERESETNSDKVLALLQTEMRMSKAQKTVVISQRQDSRLHVSKARETVVISEWHDHPNSASLLQKNLHMSVLEHGDKAAELESSHDLKNLDEAIIERRKVSLSKNPSAILTELEGMAGSGEGPAFDVASEIKTLVLENLMPDLDASFERAEKTKISLLEALNTCNAEYKSGKDPLQDYPNRSRSNHKVCRQNEQSLFYHNLTDPESYCVQLGQFLHDVPLLQMPDLSDRARSVKDVSDALNTNWCDSTVLQLDTSCTEQEDQLGTKESECSRKQQVFESTYCMWKYQLETTCKELDTCHSKASTAYNNHVVEMQEFVEKWHGERTVMKQILCYCNVWIRDRDEFDNRSKYNASHFGVCKDLTVSPAPVNYGTPAGKVTCLLTVNHPGTSGFITQEYSGFMDFVADVAPCVEATTTEAPTTEAPTTEAPTTEAPTTEATFADGSVAVGNNLFKLLS